MEEDERKTKAERRWGKFQTETWGTRLRAVTGRGNKTGQSTQQRQGSPSIQAYLDYTFR